MAESFMSPKRYAQLSEAAAEDPAQFWAEAAMGLKWQRPFTRVKETSFAPDHVHIEWFADGELNIAENCLDRHLEQRGDKPAIIWEPDNPALAGRVLSYRELHESVMQVANMLILLGIKAGDRVTIYMPMIPEAAMAMLACARIGAVHSVVFAGFSAHALRSRIEDCGSKLVITSDISRRGGKEMPLKRQVDEALQADAGALKVLVFKQSQQEVEWHARDYWWHEVKAKVADESPCPAFNAEHPLFTLYTSGSTGQPKGLIHSSAGYLLYAMHTFQHVFDYREEDVYWCTADIGWITGHSYIVYGPLAAGATTLMFEGVPTWPDPARCWEIIDKYSVSLFYTAPTAIRMLMREGDSWLQQTSRKSLRVLGSVGEPINPEAWLWYRDKVGNGECAVVDTWWQTETGGHMITPIPGAVDTPPGSATKPYFGIKPVLCDEKGKRLEGEATGALCIADSWPGQARSIWGDHARFVQTYFSTYPGYYFSGDAARRDADGNYWIEGRMDDVINVAGHRIGTAEVEAVLNAHEAVAESAIVGVPDAIKGQALYAFVLLHAHRDPATSLKDELNKLLRQELGAIVSLHYYQPVAALPKTRSGKIMRRILRKIAAGEIGSDADYDKLGDLSTLLNPDAIGLLVKERVPLF